jgi:alpha-tubulin suppressor-like RCC1 family protein
VSGWTDVVAVSAGGDHTVGLRKDGTVVACGDDSSGQCNVSGWNLG